jgi:predicted DNA-binding transcriptional regulator AlpA
MEMNDKMLTDEEVSKFLAVSINTVRSWRRKKVGPPWHKVQRSVRYRESEIIEWVEKQRQDGDSE